MRNTRNDDVKLEQIRQIMVTSLVKNEYSLNQAKQIAQQIVENIKSSACMGDIDAYANTLIDSPFNDVEDFLCSAFDWSETEQGHSYWDEIHDKLM